MRAELSLEAYSIELFGLKEICHIWQWVSYILCTLLHPFRHSPQSFWYHGKQNVCIKAAAST